MKVQSRSSTSTPSSTSAASIAGRASSGGRGNAAAVEKLAATLTSPGVTGEEIAISPDLLAMMGEGETEQGPSGATAAEHGKSGFTDTGVKGTAFITGTEEGEQDVSSTDVAQGQLANCYFMAAMMAVARANPQAIRDLIVAKEDGTYDVTLYVEDRWWSTSKGAKVFNVTAEFPKNEAGFMGAATGDSAATLGKELWPMLLEKAYAVYKGSYTATEWGDSAAAMECLTGKESDDLLSGFLDTNTKPKALAEHIETSLKDGHAVTAGTSAWDATLKKEAQAKYGTNFAAKHEYAVKGVNVSAATIDLENPWADEAGKPAGNRDIVGVSIDDVRKYMRALYVLEG